jgi:hypothetical protein
MASAGHQQPGELMSARRVAHVQLVTVGLMVWLIVHRAFSCRASGDAARFSAFVVNSRLAIAVGAGVCVAIHAGDADPLAGAGRDLRVILIGFPLCAAVTFFRDHRAPDMATPAWLARAETSGCMSVMALGLALLYLGQLCPFPIDALQGWRLAAVLTLPGTMALVIGGCALPIDRADGRAWLEEVSRLAATAV